MSGSVTILGVFNADLVFKAKRLPMLGETLFGEAFELCPGGKGSNQAVAARRAGADVTFITKLGADEFGALARRTYRAEGISEHFITEGPTRPTGVAFVFLQEGSGENAILIATGAAGDLRPEDMDAAESAIAGAQVFLTQLEVPVPAVQRGLQIARQRGVITILNPAPALSLPEPLYPLIDFFTPNESEAATLVGHPVETVEQAVAAAECFLDRGVGAVVLTLGAKGVLFKDHEHTMHIPAFQVGQVIDTTGAGDAFNGGLAVGLAEGLPRPEAVRFGCAVAGLSVTRAGATPSMPRRTEIDAVLTGRWRPSL